MLRLALAVAAFIGLSTGAFAQAVDARNPVFNAQTSTAGVVAGTPTGGNLGPGTVNAQNGVFVNGIAVGGGLAVPNACVVGGTGSALTGVTLGANLACSGTTLNAIGVTPAGTTGQIQTNAGGGSLGALSAATTGAGVALLTTGGGTVDPAVMPIATTGALGAFKPDGTTITVNGTTGVATVVGGSATSVTVGTTTIGGGSSNTLLSNISGILGNIALGTSGAAVPLLNGANTWSGAQTHTALINAAGISDTAGINTTATFNQFGIPLITSSTVSTGSQSASLFMGQGVGVNLPANDSEETFAGTGSGAAFTTLSGENTLYGWFNCHYCISTAPGGITTFGDGTAWHELTGTEFVGIGADTFRNSVSVSKAVAIGRNTVRDCFGCFNLTAVGYQAGRGNAASLIIGGTLTTGDTLPIIFTAANLPGSPRTVTYTVGGTDTLANVSTRIVAAIQASINLADDIVPFSDLNPAIVGISHPGNATIAGGGADTLTVTVGSIGGAGTETLTVGNGATGHDNSFYGALSGHGAEQTSASSNNGFGSNSIPSLTSGSSNDCFGTNTCALLNSGGGNNVIGANGLKVATTAAFNNLLGNSCGLVMTGGSNTIAGDCTTSGGFITSGNANVAIGPNVQVPSATGNGQFVLQNALYALNNTGTLTTVSSGCFVFYSTTCANGTVEFNAGIVGTGATGGGKGAGTGNFTAVYVNGNSLNAAEPIVTSFAANGTYQPAVTSPNATLIRFILLPGGGSGGGGGSCTTPFTCAGGGGGGGGQPKDTGFISVTQVSGNATISVGAQAAGGTAGTAGGNGANGAQGGQIQLVMTGLDTLQAFGGGGGAGAVGGAGGANSAGGGGAGTYGAGGNATGSTPGTGSGNGQVGVSGANQSQQGLASASGGGGGGVGASGVAGFGSGAVQGSTGGGAGGGCLTGTPVVGGVSHSPGNFNSLTAGAAGGATGGNGATGTTFSGLGGIVGGGGGSGGGGGTTTGGNGGTGGLGGGGGAGAGSSCAGGTGGVGGLGSQPTLIVVAI